MEKKEKSGRMRKIGRRAKRSGMGRNREQGREDDQTDGKRRGARGEEADGNVNGRGFVSLGQCALSLGTKVRMYAARGVWKHGGGAVRPSPVPPPASKQFPKRSSAVPVANVA